MRLGYLILVLFFIGCTPPKTPLNSQERQTSTQTVLAKLEAEPNWLFPADECPAKVISPIQHEVNYLDDVCAADAADCLAKCENKDGNACYALALFWQTEKGLEQIYSEALFLRSCRYGIASGCTNRAAEKYNSETENPEAMRCAADTFEKTCALNDAWGCTMYGLTLIEGNAVEQNVDKARQVLAKSCRATDDADPACEEARKLMAEIEETSPKK